jgi:hypothetical protein
MPPTARAVAPAGAAACLSAGRSRVGAAWRPRSWLRASRPGFALLRADIAAGPQGARPAARSLAAARFRRATGICPWSALVSPRRRKRRWVTSANTAATIANYTPANDHQDKTPAADLRLTRLRAGHAAARE